MIRRPKTTAEMLTFLADAVDEVLTNIYDAEQHLDSEDGHEYEDCKRLRIAERMARRYLNRGAPC